MRTGEGQERSVVTGGEQYNRNDRTGPGNDPDVASGLQQKGMFMTTTYRSKVVVVAVVALILGLLVPTGYAQQAAKKEYAFKGKVEKIDPKAKTLTVNGENVPGWMAAMTMTYTVDKDETLNTVKAGDQITAKVYEGDFKKLYDVKVMQPPAKK